MAEARDRAAWNRTRAVLAQLYNVNRDPKKGKPIDPEQFFPWDDAAAQAAPPPTDVDRELLQQTFPKH